MGQYGHDFYSNRHEKTAFSANTILLIVLNILPEVHSAVDVGCGVGTWLSVLREKGVGNIHGIDGDWVEKDLLVIPKSNFQETDLTKTITLNKKFDLAISLEVAEHLPSIFAETFVTSLVNLSDFILFSAAIPSQGGINHVNEQWPDYWAELFQERGFNVLDVIRKEIWENKKIQPWYRQNILLFVKKERIKDLRNITMDDAAPFPSLSMVLPDLFLQKAKRINELRKKLNELKKKISSKDQN